MVVSGLPVPNNGRHVCEIADMALDLLEGIKHFKIRHMLDRSLQLRIGLHTGPCAAGTSNMYGYIMDGTTLIGNSGVVLVLNGRVTGKSMRPYHN